MLCPNCDTELDDLSRLTNFCSACHHVLGDPLQTLRSIRIPQETLIVSAKKNQSSEISPTDESIDLDFENFDTPKFVAIEPPLPMRKFQRDGESEEDVRDFRIIKKIGEGGMGRVDEAAQMTLDRRVAIKWLTDEKQRDHFLREARVTGNLEHPNIVPVYDFGVDEKNQIFYTMRKIRGNSWAKLIESKSLPENIEILLRLCDAVAYAHSRGVIHRDLKPENVMLDDYGEVLLVDWGLAAGMTDSAPAPAVTYADAIAGTPAYMAPEMAKGEDKNIGYHSDIYLLGAILFELVTGEVPHVGKNVNECLQNAEDNLLAETWVDSQLLKTAKIAMATNPSDRFQSVGELQSAIRQHSRSIMVTTHAKKTLASATQSGDYFAYFRAIGGLTEALEIWDGNEDARQALQVAEEQFAELALKNGDAHLADALKKNKN